MLLELLKYVEVKKIYIFLNSLIEYVAMINNSTNTTDYNSKISRLFGFC